MTALLSKFLQGAQRNAWLYEDALRVYVRKGRRILDGTLVSTLDVASVEAYERGKGAFTTWLAEAEEEARSHGLIVFAESILEPRLIGFFTKRGYRRVAWTDPRQVDMYRI